MGTNNSSEKTRDDLTVIKGIGEATERWFRKTFQVRTLQDLSELSVEEIEARLQRSGKPVSRSKIEDWLAQARELASDTNTSSPTPVHSDAAAAGGAGRSSGESDTWKPFASFVVEFQTTDDEAGRVNERRTTVHHVEVDRTEEWPGIDVKQLARWISERVEEVTPQDVLEQTLVESPSVESTNTAMAAAAEPAPVESPTITVHVTELRILQPTLTEKPQVISAARRTGLGVIKSGEPVSFELSFQLAGTAATEIAKNRVPFHASVYAHNRATATDNRLCGTGPEATKEDTLSYTTLLPKVTLERGEYRLDCLATLEGTPSFEGYLKVPVLQVV